MINEPKKVLLIGRSAEVMEHTLKMLQGIGYVVEGAITDNQALEKMRKEVYDAIVIGGGVEPESREKLKRMHKEGTPSTHLIEHFGDPTRIRYALENAFSK